MYTDYNYKYIVVPGKKVIALSTYAGRTVKGVAKCSPDDVFDEKVGMKLAAARCNRKIASKRAARARQQYNAMLKEIDEVNVHANKVFDFFRDASAAEAQAVLDEAAVRGSIKG